MYAKGMKLPEGKKCAAFITVNLSAEFFWLSLDKKAADMPKTLSLGQYGMTHGLPRLLDLLDEFHIKATFFVLGTVMDLERVIRANMVLTFYGLYNILE